MGRPGKRYKRHAAAADELTVMERREELVQRGEFVQIYESIVEAKWSEIDLPTAFSQLLRAIDLASRNDPAHFSDEVLRVMTSLCTYVMMRAQYGVIQCIAEDDSVNSTSASKLSHEILSEWLPQLRQIHGHVMELNRARATNARLWQLAKQKERENQRADEQECLAPPRVAVEVIPECFPRGHEKRDMKSITAVPPLDTVRIPHFDRADDGNWRSNGNGHPVEGH